MSCDFGMGLVLFFNCVRIFVNLGGRKLFVFIEISWLSFMVVLCILVNLLVMLVMFLGVSSKEDKVGFLFFNYCLVFLVIIFFVILVVRNLSLFIWFSWDEGIVFVGLVVLLFCVVLGWLVLVLNLFVMGGWNILLLING